MSWHSKAFVSCDTYRFINMNIDADDDDDDDMDSGAEEIARIPLQAAIAWIATRDRLFTLSLSEWQLEKMEDLIKRAGLVPECSVEESWIRLRGAVVDGSVAAWGQKFVLASGFELGDVWPFSPEVRLSGDEIDGMAITDERGMALHPAGILTPDQTWICRVTIQKDQLEAQFALKSVKDSQDEPLGRDHKSREAMEVYLQLFPTARQRSATGVKDQLMKLNERLKELNKEKIAEPTLKRLRSIIRGSKSP
jgi:hypothetical protein